jgi:hypothetical protein
MEAKTEEKAEVSEGGGGGRDEAAEFWHPRWGSPPQGGPLHSWCGYRRCVRQPRPGGVAAGVTRPGLLAMGWGCLAAPPAATGARWGQGEHVRSVGLDEHWGTQRRPQPRRRGGTIWAAGSGVACLQAAPPILGVRWDQGGGAAENETRQGRAAPPETTERAVFCPPFYPLC